MLKPKLQEFSDGVWRVVHQSSTILRPLDTEWAIGGAVAMAAHGYLRATTDIDIFVADEAREELFEGLEALGHRVRTVNEPLQYAVGPEDHEHVEFLFPTDMPEVSAIWKPIDVIVKGEVMPMMRGEYLVASKLLIEPDDPRFAKDLGDLVAMHERGLIDGPKVLEVLDDCPGATAAKRRLAELLSPPERSRSGISRARVSTSRAKSKPRGR